jgi:hypothetical protein
VTTFDLLATGLGDCIGMAGAAVAKHKMGHPVRFRTLGKNMVSVLSFFRSYPEIEVTGLPQTTQEWQETQLKEFVDGLNAQAVIAPQIERLDFLHRSYIKMGVEYAHRWVSSPIPEASFHVEQDQVDAKDYIFVHDDRSRGFSLDYSRLPKGNVFRPGNNRLKSILCYRDAMLGARELHLMDGPFFLLADTFPLQGKNFLHRYPRTYCEGFHDYATQNKWVEVW